MAESRVFLLTVVLLLNMEPAGLARGILLLLYLTKTTQARANTRAATSRQMMARPQPGIGWSGVTAVVTTELVTVLLSVLLTVEDVDDEKEVVVVDVVVVVVEVFVVIVVTTGVVKVVLLDDDVKVVVVVVVVELDVEAFNVSVDLVSILISL